MENGDMYNLTAFSMCAHNGTHVDAPRHFIKDGETVDRLQLYKTVGRAYVADHEGILSAVDAENILCKAKLIDDECARRILVKGNVTVSNEAAELFAKEGLYLIGVESQSVGAEDAPATAHRLLLGSGTVLLEGIRLEEVDEGAYLLNAVPINLGGADGAPCRAILIDDRERMAT